MASQVSENLAFINGGYTDEEFKEMELLKMNNALIMSLMDESHGDDSDNNDGRLETLIRSLEAEITMEGGKNSSSSTIEYELAETINGDDNQSWIVGQMDGHHDYLASPCDILMEWVDMDVVPSAPFDERIWSVDPYGNSMDATTELFDVSASAIV